MHGTQLEAAWRYNSILSYMLNTMMTSPVVVMVMHLIHVCQLLAGSHCIIWTNKQTVGERNSWHTNTANYPNIST